MTHHFGVVPLYIVYHVAKVRILIGRLAASKISRTARMDGLAREGGSQSPRKQGNITGPIIAFSQARYYSSSPFSPSLYRLSNKFDLKKLKSILFAMAMELWKVAGSREREKKVSFFYFLLRKSQLSFVLD